LTTLEQQKKDANTDKAKAAKEHMIKNRTSQAEFKKIETESQQKSD